MLLSLSLSKLSICFPRSFSSLFLPTCLGILSIFFFNVLLIKSVILAVDLFSYFMIIINHFYKNILHKFAKLINFLKHFVLTFLRTARLMIDMIHSIPILILIYKIQNSSSYPSPRPSRPSSASYNIFIIWAISITFFYISHPACFLYCFWYHS